MKRFLMVLSFYVFMGFIVSCTTEHMPFSSGKKVPDNEALLSRNSATSGHMIMVAPPTGDAQTDRSNIEAAVAQAQPGDIIQLQKGTYVIGAGQQGLVIDVPNTVLQGHPQGTILRGGEDINNWGQFEDGLILTGGHQTVQNITFELFSISALYLNADLYAEAGGYVITNNKFLRCWNAIVFYGQSDEVSVISHNVIDNTDQGIWVIGKTVRIQNNQYLATNAEETPLLYPGNVGGFGSYGGVVCENNEFVFNTIKGIADGLFLYSIEFWGNPNTITQNNLVAHNKFIHQSVHTPGWDFGSMVWLSKNGPGGGVENNKIIDNTYIGDGLVAIGVIGAAKTLITRNYISNTKASSELPFLTGLGIVVNSSGSYNSILNNSFSNNENYDIALYGDHNFVVSSSNEDKILDVGEDNTVVSLNPGGPLTHIDLPFASDELKKRVQNVTDIVTQLVDHLNEMDIRHDGD